MMVKRKPFSLFYCSILLVLSFLEDSCVSHDFPNYTCGDAIISYTADVNPIVITKCAINDCHNGDNGDDINWTRFSNFQGRSHDVKVMVATRTMPPPSSTEGPLSQEEINTIACWVDQGAQNN